jgi:hypothetical protein
MGRSRTWFVKASTIANQSELSGTLIRLMLSVNDISLASDANDEWAAATEKRRMARKNSARMYFVRILMSHVYEALLIVRDLSQSQALRAAVDKCDTQTVAAFRSLETFIDSSEMKALDTLRNRASFHYDRQLPERSLREIAHQSPNKSWSYSMGSEALDWYFELGDAVMDRIVIRDVLGLKLPKGPERTKKTEEVAGRLQEISITFTNFAAHFVRHYSR